MARTPGPLDDHMALIGVLKITKGAERESAAQALVAISAAAAAHWRHAYPDDELPQNPGFERLIIEHGKRKDWAAALATALLAKAQGWHGDWDHRIQWAAKHVPRETK